MMIHTKDRSGPIRDYDFTLCRIHKGLIDEGKGPYTDSSAEELAVSCTSSVTNASDVDCDPMPDVEDEGDEPQNCDT
jgi:hypothetical protein